MDNLTKDDYDQFFKGHGQWGNYFRELEMTGTRQILHYVDQLFNETKRKYRVEGQYAQTRRATLQTQLGQPFFRAIEQKESLCYTSIDDPVAEFDSSLIKEKPIRFVATIVAEMFKHGEDVVTTAKIEQRVKDLKKYSKEDLEEVYREEVHPPACYGQGINLRRLYRR